MKALPLVWIGLLCMGKALGQIEGVISDAQEPVAFAAVCLIDNAACTSADVDGNFSLPGQVGDSIRVSAMGYETTDFLVTKANGALYELGNKLIKLDEVSIVGKSAETVVKEEPFAVEVIDAKPLKAQNLDVNQILNTTSGARIREAGGLGSDFNFSLNGFSGKQVRFFIDGVPMDNYGSALSLNNIPVNLISRIEIYKGVVPIHLGSDALGGAVNVVTSKHVKSFADFSYAYGSFNTHRASIISRYVNDTTGLIVNGNAFFNYSDNDFEVEVSIPDLKTGKYGEPEIVKHFNDAYQSQMVQIETGYANKKFADQLVVGVIGASNHKEVQTGANMNQVAGQVYTEDKVIIPSVKYQKEDLFTDGLSVNIYANYNLRQALSVDTSDNIYDWHGNFKKRDILSTAGELTWYKTMFRFNDDSFLNTANVTYEISPKHAISVNNIFSSYTRVGEDPITYGNTPFDTPNTLNKNITGLSYNLKLFEEKLNTLVFGKLFKLDSRTVGHSWDAEEYTEIKRSTLDMGYGIASTYHLSKKLQIKGSYENTTRLPDAYELFGNGLLLRPNVNLVPEKSKNYNVGILAKLPLKKRHQLLIEGTYLYRLPENLIRLNAIGVTSVYENLTSAKANIYEGGIKYRYDDRLNLEVNATYQNMVNNVTTTPTGGENYLYGDRLPNQPFLFGNAAAGYIFKDFLKEDNLLSFNWSTAFVEAFYLKWPSQGYRENKYDIPRQLSHAASIAFSANDGKYNISLACTNVMNSQLFDNFMLQKPGRAFNIKCRYFITKNN